MKRYALSLLALCILSGCASSTVHYVALSEKAAANLKKCIDAPVPDRVVIEHDADTGTALNGKSLRQCQRAAGEALDQHERARLRDSD